MRTFELYKNKQKEKTKTGEIQSSWCWRSTFFFISWQRPFWNLYPGCDHQFHQLLHPIFWQMWFYVEMKFKKNTTKQTHKNEHNCARNCLKAREANHSLLLPGSAPHQSEMSFVGGQWEHGCRVKMPFRSRRQAQQKAATHFIQSAHDSLPSLQVYIHTNSVSIINTKYNRIRRLTWAYCYTNT